MKQLLRRFITIRMPVLNQVNHDEKLIYENKYLIIK
jgi:hypothetical protein